MAYTYRLYLGLALIALGVLANVYSGFWPAFPAYLIGLILIAGHFFIGPLRLIQEHMETGNLEGSSPTTELSSHLSTQWGVWKGDGLS